MGFGRGEFGPDTVMGIVPTPHVLIYYAIFFFYGVFYFITDDPDAQLGAAWRASLAVALLVIFPIALETATGVAGIRDRLLPANLHKPASIILQAVYAWLMIFGCIGMFGVGVGMLYTPILVDRLQLTFPSGLAVANILRALTDPELLKRSVARLATEIGRAHV